MEPWQKVYINLGRKTDVAQLDYHMANMSCVSCHGGDKTKPNNMEEAHTGLIKDPSAYDASGKNSCSAAGCHESTSENFKNSLHQQLWGERRMVALRSGVDQFAQCPQSTQDGFNGECTNCHATCGDCHVSIPNSAGRGFVNSHRFIQTPDPANNCMACHGSRLAHDFLGDYENYPPRQKDLHSNFYTCTDCHQKVEMHASAAENTDRYHYEHLPSCEDAGCHVAGDSLREANAYHRKHFDDLSCFVCHSQEYNNCTSCHVKDEWKTDPNYQNNNPVEDFKIGLNPLKTDDGRLRFKFAALRHVPVDPKSYENWGPASAVLPSYDDFPTWKYTSSHSIRKYTARTDTSGGKLCWESCHTKEGFGNPANKKYFLFRDSVSVEWPDEVNANESVFVDDALPDGWK